MYLFAGPNLEIPQFSQGVVDTERCLIGWFINNKYNMSNIKIYRSIKYICDIN